MARDTGDTISLRFKYGIHTVFLTADPLAPFSQITQELLDVLRASYPGGLTVAYGRPERVPVPGQDDEYRVAYATPKNPKDLSYGWKPVTIRGKETPAGLKLRENAALAFQIQTGEAMEEEPRFEVAIPVPEEE